MRVHGASRARAPLSGGRTRPEDRGWVAGGRDGGLVIEFLRDA
jgi:hypothetical protein